MPKHRGSNEAHISLLELLPDEQGPRDFEMYFWYDGNPFGLETNRDAIVAMDGQIYQTQSVEVQSKEAAAAIYGVSDEIGYLIAKKNFMVVRTPATEWNSVSHSVVDFFPATRSVVAMVKDKKKQIAKTNIRKRMNHVRQAEGRYATDNLLVIEQFVHKGHDG